MHSLVRKGKRQDELWLVGPGRAGRTDKPRQALTLRKGYLANYKLLTKKKSNTWPFQKGIRSVNSVPFNASIFVQPFIKFFCYPSKISCHYRQNFLFKIRSQYTRFSLFWLCTEVQKVTHHHLSLFQSPQPFTVSPLRLRSTTPRKWSNMQLVFQHGPISRESKNIETILTIWNGYSRK